MSVLPAVAGAPPFQAAAIVFLPLSGHPLIDGVLFDGRRWASATLTYSFPDSPADYEWPYGAFNEPSRGGVTQVSARQMQVTGAIYEGTDPGSGLRAYASVESLTALDFVRAGFNDAVLRIAGTPYPVAPAWTYLPNTNPAGGDTWFLNGTYGCDFTNPVLGDYFYFGHLHEFMHGLGLKDGSFPHAPSAGSPATPALPAGWDSLEFSVNSYRSHVGAPTDGYRNEAYGFPQTPMMLDIAGLQYLYGADFGTQADDTVYRWNPATGEMAINGVGQGVPGANRVFLTIWDGGGTDTLDLSNHASSLSVDLTPGGWSTLSTAQLAVLNARDSHVLARGNVFNALQYQGDPRSLIENATGGPSHDRMLGNVAANHLDGGDGQDRLLGGAGNDTLLGDGGDDALYGGVGSDRLAAGAGNDRLSGGHGADSAVFTGNRADYSLTPLTGGTLELRDLRAGAPDGHDTLTGIENLQFADTLLALGALPSADSPGSAGDDSLLWRGQGGEVASWRLDGTRIASTGILPFNPGASWAIAHKADLDGDGRPDILWRGLGGEVAVWQMNGSQILGTGILPFNPGLYWAIAGTGDFDGDLRADILWRGQGGEVAIWRMNGQQILGTGILPFNPGLYWAVAGTGDFDGDARADILWRGQGGEVAIWQMNGPQIASTAILPLNPGTYWTIEDSGEFNGDVRSDILWRGRGGEVAIWEMNGTQPASTGGVAFNPGSYWAIEGSGDFDGNGLSDIAWRGQGGEVAIWQMNGTLISSSAILPFNPGDYWDVALLASPLA